MVNIPAGNKLSFDTETCGLFPKLGDQPYCFSWCNEKGDTAVLSFPVDPKTRQVKYDDRLDLVRDFAQNKEITKIGHNLQFDRRMVEGIGIKFLGPQICTMSLIRLLKSSAPLALKPFCEQYLNIPVDDETELRQRTMEARRLGKKKGWKLADSLEADYWMAGPKYYEPYCIRDAERAMLVYQALRPQIEGHGLSGLWKNELRVWKVLRKIEDRGIAVNKDKVLEIKEDMKSTLDLFKKKAEKLTGPMNFRSPIQLKKVLYDEMKEPVKYFSTKGHPSTAYPALRDMKNPVAKYILEMRACEKTIEFMDTYLKFMVNGVIHPEFSQSIPRTGRESAKNPNLQQVSSGESSKEIQVKSEARAVFVARPNHVLRSYDWKNIEVYIPAFASGDKKLLSILKNGGDVHQSTADFLSKKVGRTITRFDAKRIFFGLQYGMGRKKLSKELNIPFQTAEDILYYFQESYPILIAWMEQLKGKAVKQGYIRTPYGRMQETEYDFIYKVTNQYIQGTAADILKFSKVRLYEKLKPYKAYMVLPIHDELLIEIHQSEDLKKIDDVVVSCMQDNPELKMGKYKIPVSISAIKSNWLDKEKICVR